MAEIYRNSKIRFLVSQDIQLWMRGDAEYVITVFPNYQ
jgi:hypothetical protein